MAHLHQEPRTFVKARRVRSFDDVVEQVRAAVIDGSITAGDDCRASGRRPRPHREGDPTQDLLASMAKRRVLTVD